MAADGEGEGKPPAPAPPASRTPAPQAGGKPPQRKFWPAKQDLPPRLPDPEPVEDYDVPLIIFGTALWAVAGVVMFAMHDTLEDHDKGWWPYTSLVGVALGLLGIRIVVGRRARRRARDAARTTAATHPTAAQPTAAQPTAAQPTAAQPTTGQPTSAHAPTPEPADEPEHRLR